MKTPHPRLVALLIAVGMAAGCGDNSTAPTPPALAESAVVSLVTPNSDDGAVVVTVHGPGLSTIESAASGYLFYSRLASEQDARLILVGNITAGPLFTFKVANGSALSAYTISIEQVASRSDTLRASTDNYRLTIAAAR